MAADIAMRADFGLGRFCLSCTRPLERRTSESLVQFKAREHCSYGCRKLAEAVRTDLGAAPEHAMLVSGPGRLTDGPGEDERDRVAKSRSRMLAAHLGLPRNAFRNVTRADIDLIVRGARSEARA